MNADLETLRAFFRRSPFMVELGVEPVAVERGRVTTVLALQTRHQQHTGVVHAGVAAALADHTMGAAAQTTVAAGHWVLTVELKTSLLRAARGARLVCDGRVLQSGRRLAFTEAEVWCERDDDRLLVAKASATMAVTAADV
jgi:uncharacterized protein (TIGR00369 family)